MFILDSVLLMCKYHLKERQVGGWDAIKVDSRVVPGIVEIFQLFASVFVWNDLDADDILLAVLTTAEPPTEQRDAHDTEHQPEDQADQQNVEYRRYRLHQRVHYHLPYSRQLSVL